jgi:hypothetical protein
MINTFGHVSLRLLCAWIWLVNWLKFRLIACFCTWWECACKRNNQSTLRFCSVIVNVKICFPFIHVQIFCI